jgi:glycosyltransferase involved in cell wall biosynthesis
MNKLLRERVIMTQISLILPAYNEAERLKYTVPQVADTLRKITPSFEIIIAEDGSTDGTDKIAEELAKEYPYTKHLHSKDRLGRGKALNRAFKSSKGEVLAYIDVDLATDLKHLEELINSISEEGYDFSTGSRMLKESDVKRSFTRLIASKGFNLLTRLLLKSEIKDHQCGFKAFKRKPLFDILDEVKDEHWFWDTEILARAQRRGYKIKEFPVKWRCGRKTTVDLKRDVIGMGTQIIRLWREFKKA